MADGIVQVAPDSTGKKVDTSELTVGGQTVERQRIVIADPTNAGNFALINSDGTLSVSTPDATGTINIAGSGQTSAITFSSGRKSYAVELTGSWTGTIVFEVLVGGTWTSVDAWQESLEKYVSSTTANGVWWLEPLGAVQGIRVRATAWTTGTATGTLLASMADMNTPETNGAPGGTAPPNAVQVGGTDGTNIQALHIDPTLFALRVSGRPFECLGVYSVQANTGIYSGIAANSPMFSMRWTDATRLCVLLRVSVTVAATVAASAAGVVDRQLVIARGFTVSDSGGNQILFTGSSQKRRTSFGSTLMGDMRVMSTAALTAGTRTLDANGSGVAAAGMGTGALTTGMCSTIIPKTDLYNVVNGGAVEYPIVLAQNEGAIIRMVNAEPNGSSLMSLF